MVLAIETSDRRVRARGGRFFNGFAGICPAARKFLIVAGGVNRAGRTARMRAK